MAAKPALLILLIAAAATAAALYGWLKPSAQAPAPSVPAAVPAPAAIAVIELVVRNSRLAAGPPVVSVRLGDTVTLRITSDRADDLHLHGYDRHLHLLANEPAELTVKAIHSGRFEYELHHANRTLGTLEVQP